MKTTTRGTRTTTWSPEAQNRDRRDTSLPRVKYAAGFIFLLSFENSSGMLLPAAFPLVGPSEAQCGHREPISQPHTISKLSSCHILGVFRHDWKNALTKTRVGICNELFSPPLRILSCSLRANVLLIFALEENAAALPDCTDSLRVHAGQLLGGKVDGGGRLQAQPPLCASRGKKKKNPCIMFNISVTLLNFRR